MDQLERSVREFLHHLAVERGASTHTVQAYRRDLSRYIDHCHADGVTDPQAVTAATVESHARGLAEVLAPSSVARGMAAVRSFHTFCAAEGQADTNPALDVAVPQQPQRLPKAIDVDKVTALMESCDPSTVPGLRDRALLELLYGTGARVSEIIGLDVDEVRTVLGDPDRGLRLWGKGGKERVVPVGSFAREAVDAWLVRGRPGLAARSSRGGPALLLNNRGGRLSRQSAHAALTRAAARAHLDVPISPHTLRHSCATHMLQGGADVRVVQELLGHSSVATTQLYTLVTVDHLRDVFLASHPRAH